MSIKINSTNHTLKSFYDQRSIAEEYIETRFSKPLGAVQHRIQVETINDAIRIHQAKHILEIACGPARLTAEVSGFQRGLAIDSSDEMLSIAKRKVPDTHAWKFLKADAFNFSTDEKFDLIYSFRFLRHFHKNDRDRLYSIMGNLLTQSGIFIFDAVHHKKPKLIQWLEYKGGPQIYDVIYPTPHALITELDAAGFEMLQLKNVVRHFYIQALISRISSLLQLKENGERIIHALEQLNYGRPLEWIAICRKR